MGNFGAITDEQLKTWLAPSQQTYDPARYYRVPHAHSLYVNTLVERGIFGLTVLVVVIAGWLCSLIRYRPNEASSQEYWAVWGSALGGLSITAVVGVMNTTLHHENGILTALLLGCWLSLRTKHNMNSNKT